jgi:hypothetical protein
VNANAMLKTFEQKRHLPVLAVYGFFTESLQLSPAVIPHKVQCHLALEADRYPQAPPGVGWRRWIGGGVGGLGGGDELKERIGKGEGGRGAQRRG